MQNPKCGQKLKQHPFLLIAADKLSEMMPGKSQEEIVATALLTLMEVIENHEPYVVEFHKTSGKTFHIEPAKCFATIENVQPPNWFGEYEIQSHHPQPGSYPVHKIEKVQND